MRIRCPSCESIHSVSFELMPGQHVECSCGERFEIGAETTIEGISPPSAADDAELEEGMLLGRCRIERRIGKGAMGDVYLARHMTLDIPVAVKILRARFAQQLEFKKRFYREARTAARMDHPNVVRVLDCGEDEGALYLIMEYMSRGTVRDMLDRSRAPLPTEKVLAIAVAMCRALEAAWNHGIVHRDVKPDNIMVASDGSFKLADLGLAREMVSGESGLTVQFTGLGTPHYMAPEQAFDAGTCDIRADIYSLGATLYHAACGKPPFEGETSTDVLRQHARSTCPSPSSVNPLLPKGINEILGRAMMKKPEHRYATPADMLKDMLSLQARLQRREGSAIWALPLASALLALLLGAVSVGGGVLIGRRLEARQKPALRAGDDSSAVQRSATELNIQGNLQARVTVGGIRRDSGQQTIFLEVNVQSLTGARTLSDGLFKFQGAVYDLVLGDNGNLQFSLPDLAVYPESNTAHLRVYDRDGRFAEYQFSLPEDPGAMLRPLAPELSLSESDVVRLRWRALRPGEDLPAGMDAMTVELGWFTPKGQWHAEMTLYCSPLDGRIDLSRADIVPALQTLPRDSVLVLRYTVRSRKQPSEGLLVESMLITEQRFEQDEPLLRYPLLPEEIRKWLNAVRKASLPDEDKQHFCYLLWSVSGEECIGPLLEMVLKDEGPACYWAAFVLAELAPPEDVAVELVDRFPNPFDRRRVHLRMKQKSNLQPDDFPPGFDLLLRALDPAGLQRSFDLPFKTEQPTYPFLNKPEIQGPNKPPEEEKDQP